MSIEEVSPSGILVKVVIFQVVSFQTCVIVEHIQPDQKQMLS